MNNLLRFLIGCCVALLLLVVVAALFVILSPAIIAGIILGWGVVLVLFVLFVIASVIALIWYLSREESPKPKSTSYSIKQGKDKSNN